MAAIEEDPVTFLARIRDDCPDLLSILTTTEVKLLSRNLTDIYKLLEVNKEYLSDMICYHSVRMRSDKAKGSLSKALLTPITKSKQLDVEGFEKKKKVLQEIAERMKLVINARLEATEKELGELYLPRIVRLCRKFNFSDVDSKIAHFVLVIEATGYEQKNEIEYQMDCKTCCTMLGITLKEMIEFLEGNRPHMKHELFPRYEEGCIEMPSIYYEADFLKALMGSQLNSQEFLKIEHTKLAEVISEEPGNEHYRNEDQTCLSESVNLTEGIDETEGNVIPALSEDPKAPNVEEGMKVSDLDMILRIERKKEESQKERLQGEKEGELTAVLGEDNDSDKLEPYKTDLQYLDDHFQLILLKMRVKDIDHSMDNEAHRLDGFKFVQQYQRQKNVADVKVRIQAAKCKKRLALTRSAGSWIPRLERMVESRKLCDFEKNVLLALIGRVIQPSKFSNTREVYRQKDYSEMGELLHLLCGSLEEQIAHRKYFYKSGSLVHEGMIVVHNSDLAGDPSSAIVEVDRRMLDFCVGLDTEFSEIVEGSHLYYPKTKFDQVVLPKDIKSLILNTVSNFDAYKRCRTKMGLDDAITYGAGMVMLFHGAPGTGKTMMANALANKLNKKVLLINFPSLGSMSAGENFKFIFRESKINDAILFFDECEAIFESRESGGHQVNLLLTEIERHDGLIILATNRPYDLDEAMHRRIMVAIEFRPPDHLLRKAIWESHMPEQMTLAADIDLTELSLRFELTGGFIKNAILSALSIAVSRDGDNPVICQKDLLQGANLQLRGRLRMKDFDRRVVPNAGLDEVIVETSVMKQLLQIVQFEKARAVLFGQWGFAKRNHQGLTILLHGAPGTGKTLVAEAVGYEVGKPLKVVNCGELLSKWVGESTKNIDAIFQEARHQDAILVFDEAEGLFGERTGNKSSTDRYANVDVGVLLYHIERFPGIIILTTNLIDNIDKAFFRRLRYVLQLNIPSEKLRARLWKLLVPEETPLSDDVDFEKLARYEMSGGNIKSVIFRAAASAALRQEDNRCISMKDLEDACEDEKSSTRLGFRRQDSGAVRMYN